MIRFLFGIGLLLVLGQLSPLTGYTSEFSNKVVKTIDLAFHLNQIVPPTSPLAGTVTAIAILLFASIVKLLPMTILAGLLVCKLTHYIDSLCFV